jgi:cytochrome b involved in lipid metabolism
MPPRVVLKVNGRPWKVVRAFAKSGPADRHYVVKTSGTKTTIIFGDGVHGAKLPSGSNVEATFSTDSPRKVILSYRTASDRTPDEILWIVIRNRTHAISFERYRKFLN